MRRFRQFKAGEHVTVRPDLVDQWKGLHEETDFPEIDFIVSSVRPQPDSGHAHLEIADCTNSNCIHIFTHDQLLSVVPLEDGAEILAAGIWFDETVDVVFKTKEDTVEQPIEIPRER
jgi:hypothetical protein